MVTLYGRAIRALAQLEQHKQRMHSSGIARAAFCGDELDRPNWPYKLRGAYLNLGLGDLRLVESCRVDGVV